MPYKEHTLLRSRIEIHIPCPDGINALSDKNSAVVRTERKYKLWFGNAEIRQSFSLNPCPRENAAFEIVLIVLSFCTTESLTEHIREAISEARVLAKEIRRDYIVMVINNRRVEIIPE